MGLADQNWLRFDGWSAARGVDPLELPPQRFLTLVYHFATREGSPDDIAKFDRRLWVPVKGAVPPPESPWSAANETNAFKAFKQALQPDGPKAPDDKATSSREAANQRGSLARSNGTPGSRGLPAGGR